MTRKAFSIVASGFLSVCATAANAYDAETHALIAYKGYKLSALSQTGQGSVVSRLGLDRLDIATPFDIYWVPYVGVTGPTAYYDNTSPTFDPNTYARQPAEYERCQFGHLTNVTNPSPPFNPINWLAGDPMLSGNTVTYFPIENWLMRGDLREDDISPAGYFFAPDRCGKPEVDPYGGIIRVTNHFYDPINDVALTSGCALSYNGVCAKSVDWALGYQDSFATPPVIDTARRNHFTYVDARENMWRALISETGRKTPPYTSGARANDAQERLYRWATTFRSIGDVIHLLQDGAQPQHVRNDAHSPFTSGERQAYEGYTNARVVGTGFANVNSYVREFFAQPQQVTVPLVVTGTYPAVTFATPIRFFTTRLKTDNSSVLPDNRYGMMDYANRSFFTGGTLPGSPGDMFLEPSKTIDASYTSIAQPCVAGASIAAVVTNLTCKHLMHAVPDSVTPSYQDELPHANGQASPFSAPPLLLESAFKSVVPGSPIARPHSGYAVGLEEFQTMGNLTIPRAIGYSAGLINYFFRGQLAVTTPPDWIVGALNQGAQHTMNAQGYPCVGTATNDGCAIFGFQSIRVSVQNTTPTITESGTGTQVQQKLSDTLAGDPTDPNFHGPYLVAVAKYHRNTCYTPTLTGERVQAYSGTITEPVCASGQTVRTPYQEISVSKSFAATAAQLAPNAAAFEAHFDFSADPIPVNATDLFIQVVYRGPMGDAALGQEQDAIAVGTLDVREPTFAAFWNNTDYYWNGSTTWKPYTGTYPPDSAKDFWVCAGEAPASTTKYVFYYQGANGSPAMDNPVASSNNPGVVRIGFIFPPPDFPAQRKLIHGVPEAFVISGIPQIPVRDMFSAGQFHQANLENVSAATLNAPQINCGTTLPTTPQYWCFDPVKKRRNQVLGSPIQPMFLEPLPETTPPTDVDSQSLPPFAGITPLASGTIRFDTDATLVTCVGQ